MNFELDKPYISLYGYDRSGYQGISHQSKQGFFTSIAKQEIDRYCDVVKYMEMYNKVEIF